MKALAPILVLATSLVGPAILSIGAGSPGIGDLLDDPRITEREPIEEAYLSGRPTAPVIVSIAAPSDVAAFESFNDPAAAASHRAEVALLEEDFLARLPMNEIAVRHIMENFPCFSCDVTPAGLEALLAEPDVSWIEPVITLRRTTTHGIATMEGHAARAVYKGAGVSIAIVDTGIDYTHPDLGGGSFPNSKVIGGYDFGNGDSDPKDGDSEGHGTSCAGIAAGDPPASTPPNFYVGGVAPDAKLYALKVFANGADTADDDKVIAAWDWCVTHRNDSPSNPILAVSTSLGDGTRYTQNCDSSYPAYATAANNCAYAQMMLFISSGNDGFCDGVALPACLTAAIAVGAVYDDPVPGRGYCEISTDSCIDVLVDCDPSPGLEPSCTDLIPLRDQVCCYSNSDDQVVYLAPSFDAETPTNGGGYTPDFGGTSAAAPYAAGALALYQSAFKSVTGVFQDRTGAGLTLAVTGDFINDPKSGISTARINLHNAIATFGPANDDCADAIPLAEGVPTAFTNQGATTDGPDEPNLCDFYGYTQIDADVWFSYLNDCGWGSDVTVSLCGSSFDTKVAIYDTYCPPSTYPQAIACNDDSCGTQSEVTFYAHPGDTYLIRVGGYQGARGNGIITVTQNLLNDDCANAIETYAGVIWPFCTMSATTDGPAEPSCNFPGGDTQIHKDIWFRYTAICDGWITADLCTSDFDTKIAVYEESCPPSGTLVACNDDSCGYQSRLAFWTSTGTSYLLRIGGYNGDSGHGAITLTRDFDNDSAENPLPVTDGLYPFCTEGALTDGPLEPGCDFSWDDGISSDLWFYLSPGSARYVTASACYADFDCRIAVYEGGAPPTGTLVGCSESSLACDWFGPHVGFYAKNAKSYWIRVGGRYGEEGSGVLEIASEVNRIANCQGIDGLQVLKINGTTGGSSGYVVQAGVASRILFSIDRPPAGGNGKFVVHMNPDVPTTGTITPLPAQLGPSCFPILLTAGADPVAIWTNMNKPTSIGVSNFFGESIPPPAPAPTTFYDSYALFGFPVFTSWTIQGVIRNPASTSPRGGSVTNAVILHVVP